MVLGGASEHRRSPNIDLLDRFRKIDSRAGHGFLKGIKVHHHQIDHFHTLGFGGFPVGRIVSEAKQTTMHLGMQGLNPPIHHFRKTGVLADIGYLQPNLPQQTGSSTGRKEAESMFLGKGLGEGNQSGFITDR